MLMDNGDGTVTAGPLDVLLIAQDAGTKRFHVMLFEERPLPGPVAAAEDTSLVRLKSKFHHTVGAADLDGAKAQLAELRSKLVIANGNVLDEPVEFAEVGATVLVASNWLASGKVQPAHLGLLPPAACPAGPAA